MIKAVWSFLGSLRLVIPLLMVLTFVSILGILIPQGQSEHFYAAKLGQTRAAIVLRAELDHVFSALWFYGLLGLLSLSVIACSTTRLWRNMGRAAKTPFLADADAVAAMKRAKTLQVRLPPADAARRIGSLLQGRLFLCRSRNEKDGGVQVSAHSGALKDVGSFLFHLGLVTLFVGGLVGRLGGYSYVENLSRGQSVPVREKPFAVRCDWFRLERGDQGEIKDYKTALSIVDPAAGTVLAHKVIEVNAPLSHGGVRFYQASYGRESAAFGDCRLRIRGPGLQGEGFVGTFVQDSTVGIPSAGIAVTVVAFVSDFVIDMQTREVTSRSSRGENPAVKVVITRGADTLQNRWVFAKFPDMHAEHALYRVLLEEWSPAFYTGIQIVDNPGVPVIWTGIIAMTIAVFLLFYVPRTSIWAFVLPAGGGACTVVIGGSSNRLPERFETEFDRTCASIESALRREA